MKLMVAIDFSESSKKVLEKAEELAKIIKAEVWLLHVAEPEPDFVGYDIEPKTGRDTLSKKYHAEHCQIQSMADQMRKYGLEVTALLVQGVTADMILKEAGKIEVDMIIIGSHGRGMMHQLLVGSVSEGIIHNSSCPVLVVPTHSRS